MFVRRPARRLVVAGVVVLSASSLAACNASDAVPGSSPDGDSPSATSTDDKVLRPPGEPAKPVVSSNVRRGAQDVSVDTLVQVHADGGSLSRVTLSSDAGDVSGALASDGASWTADERLEPGATYTLKTIAVNDDTSARQTTSFTTQALTLDQQTYPSVAPLQGETVGVGMPVVVSFDVPVTDRASFEKHMVVTSTPQQAGAWHWLSDNEAHWRPKQYWKAGTEVEVDVDVNGVDAGNGIYGQEDRQVDFEVGDAHIYRVNAATHQMKVFSNGELLRTIPVTTGKPGFTTRSGTKVILEKFASKRMNSATVGIFGAEAYNIGNIQWAMRVTYSGEFIHAAPWSVSSQGYANVSHGCTGMSTDQAGWLYSISRRGDVVEYTGTDRQMEFDNGYGDWNETFAEYAQGSALG